MKITNIKQQVRRKDRYALYIDDKYSFSLGELELINSGIKIGRELSKEELDNLKDTAQVDKLYDRVLNYLAIRPRSEWEIRTYLKNKLNHKPSVYKVAPCKQEETGHITDAKEMIEKILNKLSNAGLVNDEAFARAWIGNRRLLKLTSKRRLIQELRQKRLDGGIIDKVLAEDETNELTVLRELVSKKRQQSRYQDDLKLMQYLSRQGYNYNDIKAAIYGNSNDA